MEKLKIFIGYDRREPLAYEIAKYSILRNSETPEKIEVYPIVQPYMRELGIYTRPKDKQGSTEFTLTRFWVPYLANYNGWALFTDCDFIFMGDILQILNYTENNNLPVYVCKHEYEPRNLNAKMDGQKQHVYPKKNWSSAMLFNCSHPALKLLNPSIMNDHSIEPRWFHRFEWLPSDDYIGSLPLTFNWLAGETQYNRNSLEKYIERNNAPSVMLDNKLHPIVYHYTLGSGTIFSIVDDKFENKSEYPYLYDLMMEEVNNILVQYACEMRKKSWEEIKKEERSRVLENMKNYEIG